jgi:4-amino-4-deoxy-L-arabinose transferase-like glycosyltransferase
MTKLQDWVLLRPYAALTILCFFLYLPGFFSLAPMDRDESRFAQATKQMIKTGDFVSIKFQETERNKKPIGIYWAQAPFAALFGGPELTKIWAYRIPSLLGALGATLLTFWLGRQIFDPKTAIFAALIMGSSLLLTVEANLAKTDAALLAATLAAQGVMAIAYTRKGSPTAVALSLALGFWAALAVGVLLKGPITPLVVGATAIGLIIYERSAGWLKPLRPLVGAPLFAAIVIPWFVAISIATGGAFFSDAVGGDLLPKLLAGQESHGAPPGFYTLLAFVLLWPGSLLLAPGLFGAWGLRKSPAVRFCIAWAAPLWILFELAPTKLPHYVLPLLPAIALLAAVGAKEIHANGWAQTRPLFLLTAKAAWLSIGFALIAVALTLQVYVNGNVATPSIILATIGAVALAASFAFSLSQDWARTITAAVIGAFLSYVLVFEMTLARLDRVHMSQEIMQLLAINDIAPGRLIAVGYAEPSLVFLAGADTSMVTADVAAALLNEEPQRSAIVERRFIDEFRAAAGARALVVKSTETITGLNYSNGRRVDLTLFTVDLTNAEAPTRP